MSATIRERMNPAAAVLWASAFVIAALIILQTGRIPTNPAHADMVHRQGDYTLLTTDSGRSDNKLLYVLDARNQALLVYEVTDSRRGEMHLRDGGSLDVMFRNARQ